MPTVPDPKRATVNPPLQTVGDALERARDYIKTFAAEAVAGSYPSLAQEEEAAAPKAIAPVAEPEEPAEEKEESPAQPPEETPEETEEESKPEEPSADEEQDTEEEEAPAIAPEIQESINKRIGKEVAKTKAASEKATAAEARVKELEALLGELRSVPPERQVVKEASPLSEVTDVQALTKRKTEVQSLKAQVEDLLEIVEDDPEEVESKLKAASIVLRNEQGEEDYSVKRMRKTLRQMDSGLRQTLERHIPEREGFIKEEAQLREKVFEQLPELRNPISERSKIFRSVLEQLPEIKLNPKWPLFVAGQVLFLESLAKSQAQTNGKKPVVAPPKIPAKPKSAPSPSTPKSKKAGELMNLKEQMLKGNSEARVKYLQSILED